LHVVLITSNAVGVPLDLKFEARVFCLSTSLLGLGSPASIFVGLRLSLLRIAFGGFRLRLGFGLGVCGRAAGGFLAFSLFLAGSARAHGSAICVAPLSAVPIGMGPCLRW
jgi:hypothetical protein